MTLQHSYSGLSTFDVCPEQYRHLYIIKDYRKTYTVEPGIDAHKAMEQRIRYQQPLPEPLQRVEPLVRSLESSGKVEVELSLAVARDMTRTGFWDGYLRGKYDVVLRWPEQRRAFIGDWKTGKVRESSDQLEIGAMLLMANDPAIDSVTGANLWVQIMRPGSPYGFSRNRIDSLWLKWIKRIQAIEREDPAQVWERRESGLCGYCPVADCPHYHGG
jgi:hypothetical protein